MSIVTLILPGLSNSGPEHWQSIWERDDPTCVRVLQNEWEAPVREDWTLALDRAVRGVNGDVVLVAHSTACLLVAHWAAVTTAGLLARVRGALLVAPSDPEGPQYPPGPTGFAPVPLMPLPFRSLVVASTDDVYVTLDRAQSYATAWGSTLVNVGPLGHINAASGHGVWPAGYALLEQLRAT
ncbi:MAG: alpha/beta hydrolase [bacterium]